MKASIKVRKAQFYRIKIIISNVLLRIINLSVRP